MRELGFLHRLVAALHAGIDESAPKDAFLAEASRLHLEEAEAVKFLARVRRRERLMDDGPQVIDRDSQDRVIYHRCPAEYKNKSGHFELREDGVTFKGEVLVEIQWANVVHVAQPTHTYKGGDYDAIAIQEGKRRTATLIVFPDGYGAEVTLAVWGKRQDRGSA